MDRSTQQRERRLLLGLIAASIILALLGSKAVEELAVRWLAPYNMLYPQSLLALYHADYTHWAEGPGLAALDPRAVEAAGESALGRFRRRGLLDVAVPVAVPSPVAELPSLTPSPTSVPPTATATPPADTATPSSSPTPSLTSTPSLTPGTLGQGVATRTPSPEPSSSATPISTNAPSSLPPIATSTDIASTATARSTATDAPTVTTAPSSTTVPSATNVPSAVPNNTPIRPSVTTVPSVTVPPTGTASPTETASPTATATATDTSTPSPTATNTSTPSPTATSIPVVSFNDDAQRVFEGVGQVTIPVRLSTASSQDINVPYTVGGTANNPADHNLANGTINFPAGSTSASLTFNVVQDKLDEPNETVLITLGASTGVGVGSPSVYIVTIVDDDPPTVQFSSGTYNVQERPRVSTATITATLSSVYTSTVLVDYATIDGGTATADRDYIASTGTLTFIAGQTTQTFTVTIQDDNVYEGNETVNLRLTNPNNATLGSQSTATLTINDNETQPTVSFVSSSQTVPESVGRVTVPVRLNLASSRDVSIPYTVSGTASNPADYDLMNGTIVITAGLTTTNLSFNIVPNTIDEPDENVVITLGTPTGAGLVAPIIHTVTITDDDDPPTVQFSTPSYNVVEGNTVATITATLSMQSEQIVRVNYATSDGTATAGVDYDTTIGRLTFNPGQTLRVFTVPIKEDDNFEGDETVRLILGNPFNATLGTQSSAVLTIKDDDVMPTVQFSSTNYTVNETDSTATITVILSGNTLLPVSVDYATSDATAKAGNDYIASSGTLNFPVGTTTQTFNVSIKDDKVYDPDEMINLKLSNARFTTLGTAATLGTPNTAILKIVDDDPKPTVSFSTSSYSVDEGNAGGTSITVLLSAPSDVPTMVTWSTLNNSPINTTLATATPGDDYTVVTSGTLVFSPGQTSATFIAPIKDDTDADGGGDVSRNEVFGLQLTSDEATITNPSSAQVVIVDDDPIPSGCADIAATQIITLSQTPEIQYHDNQLLTIGCGRSTIIDLETKPIRTSNSPTADLTYYESEYHTGTIAMDWTIIQVAESLNGPWYTVLYWGDDVPDDNTDLRSYWNPNINPHETDNLEIGDDSPRNGLNIPANGIGIDIDAKAPRGTYRYIKFISPRSGNTDAVDVDAIIPTP